MRLEDMEIQLATEIYLRKVGHPDFNRHRAGVVAEKSFKLAKVFIVELNKQSPPPVDPQPPLDEEEFLG